MAINPTPPGLVMARNDFSIKSDLERPAIAPPLCSSRRERKEAFSSPVNTTSRSAMTTASTCEALIASGLFCRVRGTIFTGKEKPRRSGAKVTDQPSATATFRAGSREALKVLVRCPRVVRALVNAMSVDWFRLRTATAPHPRRSRLAPP